MGTTVIRTLATRVTADAQEFSKEMRRAEKDAERFTLSVRRQIRELEMGADEAKLYELSLRGVSGETLDATRAILAQRKAIEDSREATEKLRMSEEARAARIAEFKDEVRTLRLREQVGAIEKLRMAEEKRAARIAEFGEEVRVVRLREQWKAIEDQKRAVLELAAAEQARAAKITATPIDSAEQISTFSGSIPEDKSFGAKELKNIATILKGGGILAGFKILASQFLHTAEAAEKLSVKLRAGESSLGDMRLELIQTIPVIGDLSKGLGALVEVFTGAKAFEQMQEKARAARREFEDLIRSIRDARSMMKATEEQLEIAEINRKLIEDSREVNARAIERLEGVNNSDTRKQIKKEAREAIELLKEMAEYQKGLIALRPDNERGDFLKALREEVKLIGMSEAEATRYHASLLKLNAVQMAEVETLIELRDAKKHNLAMDEQAKRLRDSQIAAANQVRDSIRTPFQVLRDEIEEIIDLVENGFLDKPSGRSAITNLIRAYRDANRAIGSPNFVTSAQYGSSQAVQSILNNRDRTAEIIAAHKKTNDLLADSLRRLDKIERNTGKQPEVRDL